MIDQLIDNVASRVTVTFFGILLLSGAALTAATTKARAEERQSMNAIVEKVVKELAATRARGGYDINKAFTRDLDYGSVRGAIKASDRTRPPAKPTMCVAATAEVIIESLNKYAKETGDFSPFLRLPQKSWTNGNIASIRANIFMYPGTGSRGTGYALARLGLGEEKTFDRLNPYDFVNLNRPRTGHSVVFIAYLDKDYNELPNYSDKVSGFKYFSAQGKGRPDAGLAYR